MGLPTPEKVWKWFRAAQDEASGRRGGTVETEAQLQELAQEIGRQELALEQLTEGDLIAGQLTSEQLGRLDAAVKAEMASNGDVKQTITFGDDKNVDITNHAIERAMQRSVEESALVDALQNPLKTTTIKYDKQGRPSCQIVGEKATVVINPETGAIITMWPTHTKTAEKLKRG